MLHKYPALYAYWLKYLSNTCYIFIKSLPRDSLNSQDVPERQGHIIIISVFSTKYK